MWDLEILWQLLRVYPMLGKMIFGPLLAVLILYLIIGVLPPLLRQLGLTALNPHHSKNTRKVSQLIPTASTSVCNFSKLCVCSRRRRLRGPEGFPLGCRLGSYARLRFTPHYILLNDRSIVKRVSAGLATAALPAGLAPPVKIRDNWYVDGGVVDNVPVYPLIEREKCDVIVVLRLKPVKDTTEESATRIDIEKTGGEFIMLSKTPASKLCN